MQQIENNYINEPSKPNFANIFFKLLCNTHKVCFSMRRLVSLSSINEIMTICFVISEIIRKLFRERPVLTSQFDVSKPKKTTLKCNADSFGPVCQLWFLTLECMRDSKPQRSVQQHKSRKVTRIATNRHKHINEASNQFFANNLFKISCEYTQGMLFNEKICFNAFNIRTYDE